MATDSMKIVVPFNVNSRFETILVIYLHYTLTPPEIRLTWRLQRWLLLLILETAANYSDIMLFINRRCKILFVIRRRSVRGKNRGGKNIISCQVTKLSLCGIENLKDSAFRGRQQNSSECWHHMDPFKHIWPCPALFMWLHWKLVPISKSMMENFRNQFLSQDKALRALIVGSCK